MPLPLCRLVYVSTMMMIDSKENPRLLLSAQQGALFLINSLSSNPLNYSPPSARLWIINGKEEDVTLFENLVQTYLSGQKHCQSARASALLVLLLDDRKAGGRTSWNECVWSKRGHYVLGVKAVNSHTCSHQQEFMNCSALERAAGCATPPDRPCGVGQCMNVKHNLNAITQRFNFGCEILITISQDYVIWNKLANQFN